MLKFREIWASVLQKNEIKNLALGSLHQRPNFTSTYHGLPPVQHSVLIDSQM